MSETKATIRSLRRTATWLLACMCLAQGAPAHAQDASKPKTEPGLAVGAAMADFGLRELDAQTGELKGLVWLSNFVGPNLEAPKRKKLLLLNFFATWCKPCLAELPELARLQATYAAHGLQVVSVNFRAAGESFAAALAAARTLVPPAGLSFPLLFDRYTNRNQLVYMGSQAALPCTIVIGADGKILARHQGGQTSQLQALEAQVRQLLGLQAQELGR